MPVDPPFNYREASELLRRGWSRRRLAQRYGVTVSVIGMAIQRGHIRIAARHPVHRLAPPVPVDRTHRWTVLAGGGLSAADVPRPMLRVVRDAD